MDPAKFNEVLIDKFLQGQLSQQEQADFDQRMQDPAFVEEVERQKTAYELTKALGRIELKEKLAGFESSVQEKKKRPSFKRSYFLTLAAALVLLFLGIALFNWFPQNDASLFAEYFELYRDPPNARGTSPQENTDWALAAKAYRAKNFNAAYPLFDQLSQTEKQNYLAHFYAGQCLLATSTNIDQAIKHFKTVLESDNDYRQQSQWYLALSYLQQGKKEEAQDLLKTLAKVGTYQKEQVLQLLDKLR